MKYKLRVSCKLMEKVKLTAVISSNICIQLFNLLKLLYLLFFENMELFFNLINVNFYFH